MKVITKFRLSLILLVFLSSCERDEIVRESKQTTTDILEQAYQEALSKRRRPEAKEVEKSNIKKVYVHYMPWFFSPETDGYWGQHWTMMNKNPNSMDENGKREIASHYYPLVGPYSTNDKDLQQYHLLLMKLAGIDGVIFDWYGARNVHDYQALKNSTESFIEEIEDVGLKFSIMYEDKTTEYAKIQYRSANSITAAIQDLQYIENTYFPSSSYMDYDNSKLVFLFGPQYITNPTDWETIISQLNTNPKFMCLWGASNRVGNNSRGEFSWVDPNHLTTLSNYYNYTTVNNISTVGGSYPGFNDFYYEGGWRTTQDSDWQIAHNGNQTFRETLELTNSHTVNFIQIITWNDFGEGTMIEPTQEFGFSMLDVVQSYTGVPYSQDDLNLAYRMYKMRKKYANDERIQKILDRAYELMCELDLIRAKNILNAIDTQYSL